jgi:hypothetical protein
MNVFAYLVKPASKEMSWLQWSLGFVLVMIQFCWTGGSRAALYQQPPNDTAFAVTGFIEKATLDTPSDMLSGGTVTVNGIGRDVSQYNIVIPKNTRVLMPGKFQTWQQLWANAPLPWGLTGNGETGLALSDRDNSGNPPLTTYEITIQGNCIPKTNAVGSPSGIAKLDPDPTKCTYVAGLVAIAQESLNVGSGVINFINYATGTLHVGGRLGVSAATDTLVQINDPAILPGPIFGRYSMGLSPDERFATDQDNPAIHSKTGYPMCIPRAFPSQLGVALGGTVATETDAECPQRNRPLDPNAPLLPGGATNSTMLGSYTLGLTANSSAPGAGPAVPAVAHTTGDSNKQAPFEVGDTIEFSGTLQFDTTGSVTGGICTTAAPCPYISAHQIVANLGIYTSPGATPRYVAVEVTLLGVGGSPINAPIPVPQETTGKMKVEGFLTDPTRTVDVFAVQVDPCLGTETLVPLVTQIPGQFVPWGRFRTVDRTCPLVGAAGCGSPPTREWRVNYTGDTVGMTAANGLLAGRYQIPVAEFIGPENTMFGDPTLRVIPNNFQDYPFLLNGSGPLDGRGPIVGTLDPFPLTNTLVPKGLNPAVAPTASCTGQAAPVTNAGPNRSVGSGAQVTLAGSVYDTNTVPVKQPLTYQWQQTSGLAVNFTPTSGQVGSTTPCTLSVPCTVSTSFTAPVLAAGASPVTLTFQLTATNSVPLSSPTATTSVVVSSSPPPAADTVTITGATYKVRQAALTVTATSSAVTSPTCPAGVIMTLTADTGLTKTMVCTPGVGGAPATFTYTNKPEARPNFVTVTSSLRGTATSPVR